MGLTALTFASTATPRNLLFTLSGDGEEQSGGHLKSQIPTALQARGTRHPLSFFMLYHPTSKRGAGMIRFAMATRKGKSHKGSCAVT
jgi:hypothetical protein